MDYYPDHHRLVLSRLSDGLGPQDNKSSDEILLEEISTLGSGLRLLAFDVPLSLPKCISCRLKCPGIKNCKEPHIKWFWDYIAKYKKSKKNKKIFTPYTQRPVEAYLHTQLEETFQPSDALGANAAPLTARMSYLQRHLQHIECVEVYPRLSVWRIGKSLKIMKRYLRFHKHSVDGDKSRLEILETLSRRGILFLYQADISKLISNGDAFDSLICALTAFLKHRNLTESRPPGFPLDEAWIDFPVDEAF